MSFNYIIKNKLYGLNFYERLIRILGSEIIYLNENDGRL